MFLIIGTACSNILLLPEFFSDWSYLSLKAQKVEVLRSFHQFHII